MKKFTFGKITLTMLSENDKIPDYHCLPEWSAVAFFGDDDKESAFYMRKLSTKYRIKNASDDDVRGAYVVYRGEDVAAKHAFPVVYCIGGDDVTAHLAALEGQVDCPTEALVIENAACENIHYEADAYGSAAAKILDVIDYRINCLLTGRKYDEQGAIRLRKSVVCAIGGGACEQVAVNAAGTRDFFSSEYSVSFMSRALGMIFEQERRPRPVGGVAKLLSARVLAGAYKCLLLTDFGFVFPPDNNMRCEQAADYLGREEIDVILSRCRDIPDDKLKRMLYVLKCYKAELLAEICYCERLLRRAIVGMRARLPECGYDEFSRFTEGDLRLAFALAPEAGRMSGTGLYALMKSMGVLDVFLN